jgi:hypothetical protein
MRREETMSRSIPVVFAALALTGCMNSYPLWDPSAQQQQPPPEAGETAPAQVTVEGRVESVDTDDESFELEINGEDSEEWLRVELGSGTVFYPTGARDRSVGGIEGLEMIEEDDKVVVSGLKLDDDLIRAREVAIEPRATAPPPPPRPAAPHFQPRDRVNGVVRAIDTTAGRIVLETDGFGFVAFYGDADTPVFYKGVIYKITNLEIGDGVTVTVGSTDEGDPATPWITAVDVNRSVTDDGPAPPPARTAVPAPPPAPPKPDVQLASTELEGTIKRLEGQGFEIEAEGGALRFITADVLLPVACATVERVSDLEVGMKIKVRFLEVGDRLVAQKITLLD